MDTDFVVSDEKRKDYLAKKMFEYPMRDISFIKTISKIGDWKLT